MAELPGGGGEILRRNDTEGAPVKHDRDVDTRDGHQALAGIDKGGRHVRQRVGHTRGVRQAHRDDAHGGQVVEQTAGGTVGRVHRAQEAPRLGQQLADRRGLHFREKGAAVDAPKVSQVPASRKHSSGWEVNDAVGPRNENLKVPVPATESEQRQPHKGAGTRPGSATHPRANAPHVIELLGDDAEARDLLEIKPRPGPHVARRQEVVEALSNRVARLNRRGG